MSEKTKASPTPEHPLADAYRTMLDRVKAGLHDLEELAGDKLELAVTMAKDKAAELGELTREEAEKVGDYLRRDITDAAEYLAGPKSEELADWLRFDIDLIEHNLLDSFLSVADQTKVELLRLEQRASLPPTYNSGELTGIGTLACTQCGKEIHFYKPGPIPACTACGNTLFARP